MSADTLASLSLEQVAGLASMRRAGLFDQWPSWYVVWLRERVIGIDLPGQHAEGWVQLGTVAEVLRALEELHDEP